MPQQPVLVTYLGTATLLIQIGPLHFLSDPVFDPKDSHYQMGPVQLHKTGGPVVATESLPHIDAVLLSHDQHADNLDAKARAWLPAADRVLTTLSGAERLGGNAQGLLPFASFVVSAADGFAVTVTALPAQHGPDGTEELTGPVTGFLLDWPDSPGALYLSGDTVPFDGTLRIVERYRGLVDIAVLHIGCVRLPVAPDLHFTMTASEAIDLALALEARKVIPIHYEGWAHFTEGREAAEPEFAQSALRDRVLWLPPGLPTKLSS